MRWGKYSFSKTGKTRKWADLQDGGGGGEDSHILKVELADVEWEVKESEGLIMIISFLSRKHYKESMGR